jgi:glycosyltransferase involved in cell wall biosynthesis
MKIALACRVYPSSRPGGMPHVAADRAEELVRQGHTVAVLAPKHPHWGAGNFPHNGVDVVHVNAPVDSYSSEFAAGCAEFCRYFDPDVIHLDSFDRARPWWKDRPGNPKRVCVTMHGFGLGGFLTAWNLYRLGIGNEPRFDVDDLTSEAKALACFDRVLAISLHEQTMLEDQYGLGNVRLVYNPISQSFFKPTVPPPAKRRFLCAAISGQATRMFSVAEKAAKQAGVELIVASDVPREKMPELYDSVTGLVVPTCYAQGYDLTIGEALARNRPVIMSATGSYYREFRDAGGWPGAMVPMGDVAALRDAMLGELVTPEDSFTTCLATRHMPSVHVAEWLEALEL